MTIRGVLFDKDGTLVDYWKTWVPINRETALFAAAGDAVLADELLRCGGHDPTSDTVAPGSVLAVGSCEEIAAAFANRLGPSTPKDLPREVERIFREGGAKYSTLIDGVVDMLDHLRRIGFRLGIATNDSIGGLENSIGRHGILDRFEFCAGCDSGHGAKPEPGMAIAFCNATGIRASDVVVVGDAVHDLEMGRRAGVGMRVGVLTGTSPRQDLLPHADLIIGSVVDLPRHLSS